MKPENQKKITELEAQLKVLTDKKAKNLPLTPEETNKIVSLKQQIEDLKKAE